MSFVASRAQILRVRHCSSVGQRCEALAHASQDTPLVASVPLGKQHLENVSVAQPSILVTTIGNRQQEDEGMVLDSKVDSVCKAE